MAPQSPSALEIATQLEAFVSRFRRLSDTTETQSAFGNEAIETALKEISNQLQSNKKDLEKLHQEVQSNKDEMLDHVLESKPNQEDQSEKHGMPDEMVEYK